MLRLSVKEGVTFNVDSLALCRMLTTLLRMETDLEVVITSGTDGAHAVNSRHYKGEAIDIRTSNLPAPESFRKVYETRLGSKFRVLNEGDHLHAQVKKGGSYP